MTETMIVACPECKTRFVAPLEKFLPDGRKVRCAKCSHSWFQKVTIHDVPSAAVERVSDPVPVKEEAPAQGEKPARSIIEAAAEKAELQSQKAQTSIPQFEQDTAPESSAAASGIANTEPMPQGALIDPPAPERASFGRRLLYFLVLLLCLAVLAYFFRQQLSDKFPALAPMLSSYGSSVDRAVGNVLPEKHALRIDNVKYDFEDIDGGKALLLSAEVVNNGADTIDAPKLAMTIYGGGDEILHEVAMAPEDLSVQIEPSKRAPYYLRLPHPPENFDRVEVDFASK